VQLLPVPKSTMCKRESFSYSMESMIDDDPEAKVQWMVFEPAIGDTQFPCIKDKMKSVGSASNVKPVMKMACDNRCFVIVDGIVRMVVNNKDVQQLQYERGSQISVIGVTDGAWAGMISEIDGLPTKASSWKCRTFAEEQKALSFADFDEGIPAALNIQQAWTLTDFDDSSWQFPVAGYHPWSLHNKIQGISKESEFIWTEQLDSVSSMVVFCRYQNSPNKMKIACDDICYIFVNGQKVATAAWNLASSSTGPTSVEYPAGSQIAVVGVNIGGPGAIAVRQFDDDSYLMYNAQKSTLEF